MIGKKVIKRILIIFMLIVLTTFFAVSQNSVSAASAYNTYTTDRNGDLIETNEAYEAVYMMRSLSDGTTLNGAKDMVIDSEDYIYIADTGNLRVLILDSNLDVVVSFGEDFFVKPLGIAVVDDLIYVADYGLGLVDSDIGNISIWRFDKSLNEVTQVSVLSTPSSEILEIDNFIFRPLKIAVDDNHTMYVVNEGTTSGVMIINENNRFIDYFASNSVDISLWDRIERILFSNNENVTLTKNIPTPVSNITLDGQGYYYTVTETNSDSSTGDYLKKVNIAGTNFFPDDMYVYSDIVDVTTGSVGNVYTVTSTGFICEYDNLGNLLFMWGGKGVGNDKLGLFLSASSIAIDSNNNIYVIDDSSGRNSIQIFRETPFAEQVHEALDLYNQAKYVESIDVWKNVLRYNSMFDMAYKGIGLGYQMNEEYDIAMTYFKIAQDHEDYSEAYWDSRNLAMMNHATAMMWMILGGIGVLIAISITNKKYRYIQKALAPVKSLTRYRYVRETVYMFRFLSHPADSCYEVKSKNKASMTSAWIILLLLFIIYILGLVYTGFVFNYVILENTVLVVEALVILLPIILFIISNFLMSSLMEGEGTFKATFINTIGALMPILVIYPFVIILSNFLTLNEAFLVQAGIFVMFAWSSILIYFNIKETHNYGVGQAFANLFLTILMMIILLIVLLMVYMMLIQVTNFVTDIIKEVILRG